MDLRSNISDLIEESDLSVRQLALKSGVRRQSIMRFLSGGNLHLDNLKKMLDALGYKFAITKTARPSTKGTLFERLSITPRQLAKFCKNHNITYMAFFGSVLRDDFKKDSDIDVIVKVGKRISLFDLAGIEIDLKEFLKTEHRLDVLTEESISPLIRKEIENSIEVAYDEAA
jgi:hypothetical protein